ncbi:hypothetical protein [Aureimonas sp. AU4]|uniref:hypothetical protein n=1 Tax=Aureimonas sp. AU4 TaxID=1638163 RepID=UPI000782A211|nr:hypothetical protein [Aureimonas sp. AU4]
MVEPSRPWPVSRRHGNGVVLSRRRNQTHRTSKARRPMHNIIYLIGLIVVVLAILSFLGLR